MLVISSTFLTRTVPPKLGASLAGGFAVYTLAQCNCRELFVCRLLFIEIGVEQMDDVVMAEAIGPGDQGAVPRNLVVFDRLR